jgi:hypothetical protein
MKGKNNHNALPEPAQDGEAVANTGPIKNMKEMAAYVRDIAATLSADISPTAPGDVILAICDELGFNRSEALKRFEDVYAKLSSYDCSPDTPEADLICEASMAFEEEMPLLRSRLQPSGGSVERVLKLDVNKYPFKIEGEQAFGTRDPYTVTIYTEIPDTDPVHDMELDDEHEGRGGTLEAAAKAALDAMEADDE